MYILIVEDDKLQYQFFDKSLRGSKVLNVTRLERIKTEKEFNDRVEEIATDKPDVILIDVMLRWADPAPNMEPPPPEVDKEGFYRAGLRCEKILARDGRTNNIPIIVYSVLEPEDLVDEMPNRSKVRFLEKRFDPKAVERAVRDILSSS